MIVTVIGTNSGCSLIFHFCFCTAFHSTSYMYEYSFENLSENISTRVKTDSLLWILNICIQVCKPKNVHIYTNIDTPLSLISGWQIKPIWASEAISSSHTRGTLVASKSPQKNGYMIHVLRTFVTQHKSQEVTTLLIACICCICW